MKKIKKQVKIIILVVLIIFIFLFIQTLKKSYKVQYNLKEFNISEEYYKPLNQYIFKIKTKNNLFEFSKKDNYHFKKKLITNVQYKNNCITPKSDIKLYTICFKDNKYFIKGKTLKKLNKKYKKIKFNNKYGNIFIWNHKGYLFLNKNKNINLFKKEIYDNNKAAVFDNYLITPNYEGKHGFNNFFVIDMKNGKLKKIKFSTKINHNFYYLGMKDEKIYIVDKKNNTEYALNLRKQNLELVTSKEGYGKVWQYGWKDISMVKLSYQNYKFKEKTIYNYKLYDNNLYLEYNLCKNKIFIDSDVKNILTVKDDSIYYLKDNKIYLSSNTYSKSLVLSYNELYFNNKNQVFIN